ncbi:response regulator transcription factor [Paraburkholderia solisilvae]|uniref:Protein-glutamate methylesterase/protein-glutamine glutaminase n=1 Tax=Paraburkholderia solisilvae TaxID=624376 RepID=A0A6J5DIW7_9BURK|nr:response regulator transcription factor [Paraburkholderia solisilvae]CAB3754190.1 Protein-glutamate methylesterase/protein-glutamine glutaminase [Paraburkholderia solisilvae]
MAEDYVDLSGTTAADFAGDRNVVLIVDDTPDNLALLSTTLQAADYAVLVALNGEAALKCLARVTPDVVLMDAMMPGMDGFETCRQLKLDSRHVHLPVIFMTALTETEHVVQGFRVGGIDYVTKPVKPNEVCARIAAHVRRAKAQRYSDAVLGLDGRAALISASDGAIRWQNSLASSRLEHYAAHARGGTREAHGAHEAHQVPDRLPAALLNWFTTWIERGCDAQAVCEINTDGVRRTARVSGSPARGEWILILEEFDDAAQTGLLAAQFGLTSREAEVLLWLSRGKTNRDISEILNMAVRTVNKHLEHLFGKLHVETRSSAVALAVKAVNRH